MENIEYSYIINELRECVGKRVKFQKSGNTYRLKVGNRYIIIEPGVRVNIGKYIGEAEEDWFSQKINKHIKNNPLLNIYKCGNERILSFVFPNHILFAEMFSSGNIILTDKEGKIVVALSERKWSSRKIKKGEIYKEPDPMFSENLREVLDEKYIVVCLLKLPLGKKYVKEILKRCGIEEKKPGKDISEKELQCIEKAYERMKSELKPYGFFKNGQMVDFALIKLSEWEGCEIKEYETLSEAIEDYFHSVEKENPEVEKLKRKLEKQKEALEKARKEEKEYREIADFFYTHYNEIEEFLNEIKKSGNSNKFKIISLDRKNRVVDVEVELDESG